MQATGRIVIGIFACLITVVSTAYSDDSTISSFSFQAGQTNILLPVYGKVRRWPLIQQVFTLFTFNGE
jgi:hypothetical protein